ncbi:MAG: GAF domain-containing sensor histidine kinase [Anaerolineae bacterium]|jgi:signal transduction histidine kinase
MREKAAAWLRDNEAEIVPAWIKLVRSRGGSRDRQLTTQELQRQFFSDFFSSFSLAIREDDPDLLQGILNRIAASRLEEGFQLEATLEIFSLLKELLWERLAQSETAELALSRIYVLEPMFDYCFRLLGRAHTSASSSLLEERLVEAEFMMHRLAMTTEEVDRALARLRILYNVSRAISSTLSLQQILSAVVENLLSVPQIDRCAVWLADKAGCELSVALARGIESERLDGAYLLVDEHRSAVTRAYKTRQFQVVSLVGANDEALAPVMPQRMLATVPLQGDDLPIGVISVDRLADDRPLETAVIELIQSVAEQAAVALRNSQLYEEVVELNQGLEQRVKERTEELVRLNRELAMLNKKKSDFVAIAAHELKTPLTLVQGYAEMLADSKGLGLSDDVLNDLVVGIVRGTDRLRTIVEDIIDVSMIDTEILALHVTPTSLADVVSTVCGDLSTALEDRQQTLHVADLGALPDVEADALRLHQVFSNIISNAIKYTPDGGQIKISGEHLTSADDRPDFVKVVVADNGVGIDLQQQERIFDKFYRVESPELHSSSKTRFMGAGPGLGLTIAKGIVEAHGGRIWVESPGFDMERCPGSQFHVLLPVRSAWDDFQARQDAGAQA